MAASLVPKDGGSPIALDKPILLIGRHQECDVALPESSKVSRRHCCVAQAGDRYIIRDLASMNGVRVNGNRVQEAELAPGDEVAIADVLFNFRRDDTPTKGQSKGKQAKPAPRREELSRQIPVAIPDDSQDNDAPLDEEPAFGDEGRSLRLKDDSHSEANFVGV